jgi:hypothetical protein
MEALWQMVVGQGFNLRDGIYNHMKNPGKWSAEILRQSASEL